MLDAEDTKDSTEIGNTGHLKVISDQEQVISNSAEEVNLSTVNNDEEDKSVAVADEWDFDDETHVDQETDTVDQHHHHENRIHASHHDESQQVDVNNYDSSGKDELEHPSSPSSTEVLLKSHEAGDITNDDNMKEDEQQIKDTIDSPLLEPLEEYKNNTNEMNEAVHESQLNHTETIENEHVSDDSIRQEESSSNQVSITDNATDPDESKCSPNDSNYGDKVPTMDLDLGENMELENDKSFEGNMESNNSNATSETCPKEVQDIDSVSLYPTMENDADDDFETKTDDIPPHGNGNISVDDVVDDEALDEDCKKNEETTAMEIISDESANNVDESGNVSFVEDPYSTINVDMENDKVTTVNDSIPTIDDGLSNKSVGKESSPGFVQTHSSSDSNTFTIKEEKELSKSMMNLTNQMESEAEELNALGDMNDNNETDNGSKNESMEMQSPSEVLNLTDSSRGVPQHTIEKFMSQLERIHEEHELELQNMEKKHISQMEELKEKLKIAESNQPKSAASKQAIANHDKCLRELRDLEKKFLEQLQQKEDIIEQVKEQKTLLEQRIREMVKESDNSQDNINQIEQSKREIEELKLALEKSQSELKSSQEAYSTLKERVKDVATELKDRRVECRKLSTTVNDLTRQNASLESAKNDFEAKTNKLSVLVEGKDDQIENLTSTITNLRMELSQKEKQLIDTSSIGNKALMEYKKKAQVSLSNANARAATANQAREDAEIDAANARAEAENAIKDLEKVKAEKDVIMNNKETELQEIHKTISIKEQEVTLLLKQVSELNEELSLAKLSVDEIQKNYDELVEESNKMSSHIEKQKEISQDLSQDLMQTKLKNEELEKEVAFLKEELEERVSKTLMANQSDTLNDAKSALNGTLHKDVKSQSDLVDSDGTIYLLQEELKASNEAIEELKEALANALSKNPPSSGLDDSSSMGRSISARLDPDHSESNPLFFALEKQSELRHARDEIARLVGLLGEAEFSKSDALEELEVMRQKMNEAESRLRRYEKLGPAANSNLASGKLNRKPFDSKMSSHSDSAANLEYLKNVILRFMKSTTLNEKKALIPVIAAVLELTPDEHRLALQSIEKSAGISGVGTSLIENVQSKGIAGFFG